MQRPHLKGEAGEGGNFRPTQPKHARAENSKHAEDRSATPALESKGEEASIVADRRNTRGRRTLDRGEQESNAHIEQQRRGGKHCCRQPRWRARTITTISKKRVFANSWFVRNGRENSKRFGHLLVKRAGLTN